MNKHNDPETVKEARKTRYRTKSYYQDLIARKAIGLRLTDRERRDLLRLRAFRLVGKTDEQAK